jgi:gluconolactonase
MTDPYKLGRDWLDGVVGYPDPAVEVLDQRFTSCIIPASSIRRLWTGGRWVEGPVWFGDHQILLWSDIPNDRIMRWAQSTGSTEVFRTPSGFSNGQCRDHCGRLLSCLQGERKVVRTEHDGSITTLASHCDGKRLNGPNDIIVDPRGIIWFTDPGYGISSDFEGERAEPELPNRVYRLHPESRACEAVIDGVARPNGLCFSPDYRHLYLVDTGCTDDPSYSREILVFDISADGIPQNRRSFCDMAPARGDGIRCDRNGNLWAASSFGGPGQDGLKVFAPDGTMIGLIHLPEPCSNLCFGGRKSSTLFMTAGQSIYALITNTGPASAM